MSNVRKFCRALSVCILFFLSLLFLFPLLIVLMNSFKGKFFIALTPFVLPNSKTFSGFENYFTGVAKSHFWQATFYSIFITIFSVILIVVFSSMAAWFLVRIKNKITAILYYSFVFSMIVPFQMIMFPMSKIANVLNLNNPIGILLIYLGFGCGLAVFMFSGFIKSIPIEIEEAAIIDGCGPLATYFLVVFPILKPIIVTVSILDFMWIWNDYLLPLLIIGNDYKTIPIAVQGVLTGSYGGRDMGALMAMLVLSVIPVVIFYAVCQKHVIKGVASGAIKG